MDTTPIPRAMTTIRSRGQVEVKGHAERQLSALCDS